MTEHILTAVVTNVPIGNLEIEGLLLADNSFAVAVPQMAVFFPYFKTDTNNASILLKRLMGKDFKTDKVKTEFNRNLTTCVKLPEFQKVLRKLDKLNDAVAVSLSDDLVGLSLHQLFSDAFHIKFEAEDRQDWLVNRQATKQSFWWMAGEIKQYLDSREVPSSNPTSHYTNAFKAMSKGLFGKLPKVIKEELGLGKNDLNRDHFGTESLRRIDQIQRLAKANILRGSRPMEAVQEAVEAMNFEIIDYKL
jgi:hypothetical protein